MVERVSAHGSVHLCYALWWAWSRVHTPCLLTLSPAPHIPFHPVSCDPYNQRTNAGLLSHGEGGGHRGVRGGGGFVKWGVCPPPTMLHGVHMGSAHALSVEAPLPAPVHSTHNLNHQNNTLLAATQYTGRH